VEGLREDLIAEEVWKPITGFQDYIISNKGRIRSVNPRKGSRANVNGGFIKGFDREPKKGKPFAIAVSLRLNNKTYTFRIHRLVLETFVGACPEGMECCHNDGNFRNNDISNLRWDTHIKNVEDSARHGTQSKPPIRLGESHYKTTITSDDVRAIRNTPKKHGVLASLSRQYNISETSIKRIITREVWKHVI
jgi:hypothetical protein